MIKSVLVNFRRFRRQRYFVSPRVHMVRSVIHGESVYFAVRNPADTIQSAHFKGRFYEEEELAIIARHFPVGGVFLDVGANIGNHTLYVAKFLHAARIHLIEPNPEAIDLLETNIYMNGIEDICDRSLLGIGLSDASAGGLSMKVPRRNLGGSRMVACGGDLTVRRGDEVLADVRPDFIKIDVEGMEIGVLDGLSGVIAAARPVMFIEVDNANSAAFDEWCADNGYAKLEEFRRYKSNTNYLVRPE